MTYGERIIWVVIVVGLFVIGFSCGAAVQSAIFPTYYANGYCTALGGERLTDETCNVDGKVVQVK